MLGCIIQARMGSSRLPGKVMMNIDEKNTLLHYVVQQLKFSKLANNIIIATTTSEKDDNIVDFATKMNLKHFRGEVDNVLDRYYQCAKNFSISTIVRISADDPLIDPTIVDRVIEKFYSNSYDYVSNTNPRTFPQGNEIEVFSFETLEFAWKNAKKISEKEHVTPYIYNNKEKFRMANVENSKNLSSLRWTVDTQNDLDLVRLIISKIQKMPILMTDIIDVLTKEPHLLDINKEHIIDEGYKKSISKDKH